MAEDTSDQSDEAGPAVPGETQYREVSEGDLARILADHAKWVETEWIEGKQADLRRTDLQEAHLNNANLQGADLSGANLQKADLGGADLREANLSNAELTGVRSLLVGNLAGADLTNATLPEAIAKFEGLEHERETSQNARKIFFVMLLGCIYCWLTVATTTDPRLLTNSASTPLPIIQTAIPIVWFYWAAPLILLAVYFYLQLYLQRLWEGLADLPAVFPDGKPLNKTVYPWLLSGLVRADFKLLRGQRTPLSRLENWVAISLAWWVVPLTIVLFWVRYLPRHDWYGTILLIVLIVAAAGVGFATYWLARRALRGQSVTFRWREPWRETRTYYGATTLTLAIALSAVSYGAINGLPSFKPAFADIRTWVPYAASFVGYSAFANLREADVSTKPGNWTGLSDRAEGELNGDLLEKARAEFAQVKGASLKDANLRYADGYRAFLAKAKLDGANLQGAILSGANFQKAKLDGANLQGAILGGANFRGADLRDANLLKAKLNGANLQGAILSSAKLQGARLQGANLEGTDLSRANLEGAILDGANLKGAILYGANLEKADLSRANLQGANLRFANLFKANLEGADLSDANLEKADLWIANLQGADLSYAKLQGADLEESRGLTQEQLNQACGDKKTKLPEGLKIKQCAAPLR